MAKRYEINEKDIDSVIRWLQIEDPKNANPETAIAILEHLQATIHMMAHTDPETLGKVYADLKKSKKVKN